MSIAMNSSGRDGPAAVSPDARSEQLLLRRRGYYRWDGAEGRSAARADNQFAAAAVPIGPNVGPLESAAVGEGRRGSHRVLCQEDRRAAAADAAAAV